MKRAEKAERIQAILDRLYPLPPIPLRHDDPFTLLVAVVLSAQCTDERVNLVTPGLFARAATPEAMAQLPVATIRSLIKSCGLAPAKARNIARLSKILVAEHGGGVPASLEALEALPGVGHKTASVVMVQAFDQPAFPVDTHIHRLAARWGLSSGRNVVETERDLKRVFPKASWGRVHLQMIYFGREHCPARGHDLAACPVCGWAASRRRIAAERPPAKKAGAKPAAAGKGAAKRPAAKPRGAGSRGGDGLRAGRAASGTRGRRRAAAHPRRG